MSTIGATETNRALIMFLFLALIPPYLAVPIIETIASRGSKPKTPNTPPLTPEEKPAAPTPKIVSTETTTAKPYSHSDNKVPPAFSDDVNVNRCDVVKKPLARRFTGEGLVPPTPVNYPDKSSSTITESQASDFNPPNRNRLYHISPSNNKVTPKPNNSNFDESKVFRPITPSLK
jgi:hypothetical protein